MPITKSFAGLSGFGFGILPFADMDSIATVTVGSGGAANIEFTNIPGTFQHLQVRGLMYPGGDLRLYLNGVTSTYRSHNLYGTGASVLAQNSTVPYLNAGGMANSSYFTAHVIDILDYADTSKNTTARCFWGFDENGAGRTGIHSVLWTTTDAVTQIQLSSTGTIGQYGTAALYGVRA